MKKLMFLCGMATLFSTAVQAQTEQRSPLRFGLKAGGNLSHLSISDNGFSSESNSFAPGIYGGGLLEISGPAGSKFKGQVEALFNWHNFKNKYTDPGVTYEYKTSLSQISVPIMVKYFVIPSLSINAGASVNFNVAAKTKVKTTINDGVSTEDEYKLKDEDMLQTVQIGALVGATYYIYKGFFVDARYNYYFGSMAKDRSDLGDVPPYHISALQLGIGYKF